MLFVRVSKVFAVMPNVYPSYGSTAEPLLCVAFRRLLRHFSVMPLGHF